MDESGLIVLLRKIQTRFDTILVNFDLPQRKSRSITNEQLLQAAARLNHLRQVASKSLLRPQQLNVVILVIVQDWGNERMIQSGFRKIKNVMNTTNSLFPGTVDSIILEMTKLTDEACDNYLKFRNFFVKTATLGIKVNLEMAINALSPYSESEIFQKLKNDVIKDNSLRIVYLTEEFFDLVARVAVPKAITKLEIQFIQFTGLIKNLNNLTELKLVTTWADTNEKGLTKYAECVEFWEGINEWATQFKTTAIFLQAFDTPFKAGTWISKTNGWWRLVPNSSYLDPAQFIFEEKLSLSDVRQGAADPTWLRQPTEFSKAVVGVHFSPFSSKTDLLIEPNLRPFIRQISTKFSKVLISTLGKDNEPTLNPNVNNIFVVPRVVTNWNTNGIGDGKTPIELMMIFDENTAENVSRSAIEANRRFPATVSRLIYSPTKFEADMLLDGFVAMAADEMKTFSFGIIFDVEVCNKLTRFLEVMDMLQEDFFDDLQIDVLYFSAIVSIENSKLGADRILPLLTVMFENCKKRIDQYFLSRTGHVEVAFMTGWPIIDETSPEGLAPFILFWEGINSWATKMNTEVILSSAFDPLVSSAQPGAKNKHGWWKVKEDATTGGLLDFEDKKEIALRLAKEKFNDGNGGFMVPIVTSLSAVIAIVIVALPTVFYLLKLRKSSCLTQEEIDQFFNGGDSTSYIGSPESMSGPYQKNDLELPKESFTIDTALQLGSGEYGKVCRGNVTKAGAVEEVAVKMTKTSTQAFALRGLMFEIKILSYLGKHPHIVGLIGAYSAELEKSTLFVFLELCGLGSLQSYLREYKTSNNLNMGSSQEAESSEVVGDQSEIGLEMMQLTPFITTTNANNAGTYIGLGNFEDEGGIATELDASLASDMGRWSSEIGNGMEFIASKHIVHLDLATRNVLLTSEKRAKITDFGLSRRMYDYQSYIKKHQEPLPWGSMAPESLKRSEFTEKSDVWAFGILLWEIYSLGDEPYPGISWDVNFPTKLKQGLRPCEPTYNQHEMYSIMRICWNTIPEKRPTFSTLVGLLETLLGKSHKTCSEIINEAPVTNTDANSSIQTEVENECVQDHGATAPRPLLRHQEKTWPTIRLIWLSVASLLITIVLAICFLWGIGIITKSSSGRTQTIRPPHECDGNNMTLSTAKKQCDPSTSSSTGSPLETENKERNRTALGRKLFIAIAGNGKKEKTVQALVQLGADVNVTNRSGRTPLIVAAEGNHNQGVYLKIIEFLIENDANVYKKDKHGNGDETFLNRLLYHTGNLSPIQFHNITAYLISKNMSNLFNDTISEKSFGWPPLRLAIENIEVENRTLLLLYKKVVAFNKTLAEPNALVYVVGRKRSPQMLSTLIKLGANWRYTDTRNNSLLHTAAENCYSDGVKYFLNMDMKINAANEYGDTPLHLAVDCKNENNIGLVLETVKVLIDSGANVSIRGQDGRTPLSIVIKRNDLPDKFVITQLLRDADPIKSTPDKLTQNELDEKLFDAIDQQDEDIVKLLLQVGANINAKIHGVITPLMRASDADCREEFNGIAYRIIKHLINKNGANVYEPMLQYQNITFLGHLVTAGCIKLTPFQFHDLASLLVSKNFSDLFSLRPAPFMLSVFEIAVREIDVEIRTLALLHENGVNFNHKDDKGESVLYYAVNRYRNVEFLSKIIEFGVDWNSTNINYQNLLHFAARKRGGDAVKLFVQKRMDVNAQDNEGLTPLHHAVSWGRRPKFANILEVVQVLTENGADVKIKDKTGNTPFSIASKQRDFDKSVLRLLTVQ